MAKKNLTQREQRAIWRDEKQQQRRKAEAAKKKPEPLPKVPATAEGKVAALVEWSAELRIPPGHFNAGAPLAIPDFFQRFLVDVLDNGVSEGLLCVGRKNAKSTLCALLCLGHLVGPLRTENWRAGIVSLSLPKAKEVLLLAEAIIRENELECVVKRSPYPGTIQGPHFGTIECLATTKAAGHASSFDLVLLDELGLYNAEKDREMVASLASSTSTRNGKILGISIQGNCELLAEMRDRASKRKASIAHVYTSTENCTLQDRAAWKASNPGLGKIKSVAYMEQAAEAALLTRSNEQYFRAHDLNQAVDPTAEVLITADQWRSCEVADLPEREGGCFVAIDLGGSLSMSAVACYWPSTSRLEGYACFAEEPDLQTRGKKDGCGDLYFRMAQRGELCVYGRRVVDTAAFLSHVFDQLEGSRVVALGCDRYRRAELLTAVEAAGIRCQLVFRGQGASAIADGSHDVRAFQRGVATGKVKVQETLLWRHGLRWSEIKFDSSGNPKLRKSRSRGRIDILSAGVIALGMAAVVPVRKRRLMFTG